MKTEITIVSGLPRSGTSLMMKMLQQGGMEIVADHIRKADIDNPEGYFELEKVKKIREDDSWLKDTRGKAFKMISMLLLDLPPGETYKIIFMERNVEEVLASQQKMLKRNIVQQDTDDEILGQIFTTHLKTIKAWIEKQDNISILPINYNELITSPKVSVKNIINFIEPSLNLNRMMEVINPKLYRNRIN